MTTINNKLVANNSEVLSTKESIFITMKAALAVVGMVPLAIRATGNAIDSIDNNYLDGTLKSSSNKDLLLGQSELHDFTITKAGQGINYAKDWLDLSKEDKSKSSKEDKEETVEESTETSKRTGRFDM